MKLDMLLQLAVEDDLTVEIRHFNDFELHKVNGEMGGLTSLIDA